MTVNRERADVADFFCAAQADAVSEIIAHVPPAETTLS
jgi:hypothetical protein